MKIEEWRKRSGRRSCRTSFVGGSRFCRQRKENRSFLFLFFYFELKSILLNGILKINGKLVVNASKVGFLVNLPILNFNLVINYKVI